MGHKWYSLPLLILLCKLFDSFRSRIPVNVEHCGGAAPGVCMCVCVCRAVRARACVCISRGICVQRTVRSVLWVWLVAAAS
jgi:hypothetical protein